MVKLTETGISIDASELVSFKDKFPTQVVDKAMRLTTFELLRNTKIEAPGSIPQTTEMKKISDGEYAILINHPAWRYVQFKTKPHIIEAVNAKALYFFWDKVGDFVFFKRVKHPGTKANPFLDRAIKSTEGRISEFVQTAIDEAKF
jgi:hypothetical protein